MSSGETRKAAAESGLKIRLQLTTAADKVAALPPYLRADLMDKVVQDLLGDKRVEDSPPLQLEWVEDENYRLATEAIKGALELAKRGKAAITPGDLDEAVRKALRKNRDEDSEPGRTGPVFSKAFGEFLKAKDVNPKTLGTYRRDGAFIGKLLGEKQVHEITGSDIQDVLNRLRDGQVPDGKKRAQRTRQKHLTTLRDFFNWCRNVQRYLTDDPTAGLKVKVKKSQRKKIRKGLTRDEAQRLLAGLRVKARQKNHNVQHVWLAAFIALRTGLRLTNVLRLRWFQVDFDAGTIRIPATEYKADREDDFVIPMHDELWRVLRIWKAVRRSSPRVKNSDFVLGRLVKEIKNPFNSRAKRSGVDTDFHNLRHAFETWLVEHDVPGPVQKGLMGQSPGSVTESYAHPSMDKLRECVNRLPRLRGTKARQPVSEEPGQAG